MSQSSLNWDVFAKEAIKNQKVWTVRDKEGFIAPLNAEGIRAMPFWSTLNRVNSVLKNAPDYEKFEVHEVSLEDFKSKWLKGMQNDNLYVGVNWSGNRVAGFDIDPNIVLERINLEESKGNLP